MNTPSHSPRETASRGRSVIGHNVVRRQRRRNALSHRGRRVVCTRRTPPSASRSTWPARTTSAAAGFSKTADGSYAYPNLWQRLCEEDSAHTLKATVLMTIIQGSQGVRGSGRNLLATSLARGAPSGVLASITIQLRYSSPNRESFNR